ncbi:MAG: pyrroline-5-carboxylate reductase, partial [Pseudomonadota bacterium]
ATSGLLDPSRSAVVDPNPSDSILRMCAAVGITVNPVDDGDGYDLCVLAVKPQLFPTVLPDQFWPNMDKTLFISIAAGMKIQDIGHLLKEKTEAARVIRTMPNLPAAIGQGTTLLTGGKNVTEKDRLRTTALFDAAGKTQWCSSEEQLDRLMGVSGCGPAFVFLLAEALEEAARAQGATPDAARFLAEATLVGAANHLKADGRPAGELREAVTSPGGTTAAGLSVLDSKEVGFRLLINQAVEAAFARAKELSG